MRKICTEKTSVYQICSILNFFKIHICASIFWYNLHYVLKYICAKNGSEKMILVWFKIDKTKSIELWISQLKCCKKTRCWFFQKVQLGNFRIFHRAVHYWKANELRFTKNTRPLRAFEWLLRSKHVKWSMWKQTPLEKVKLFIEKTFFLWEKSRIFLHNPLILLIIFIVDIQPLPRLFHHQNPTFQILFIN